ncbi:Phosphoenolpyruvate/pyruvate domain-containing protein [Eremomyces bilateralis CBS 781.70]|uniref:Phosphoenolpyruvate/pyruvate domain-containing protein n=1 Tax=Eremomyces bilateralis CBS 781.70 TaxID=1392243 RepID=A0A6G1GHL6_9PEZI|nr:Phosphoenolpyruvate/pyruvate domain-containing protein [Eremomyces bilateralis CBS 781.70]KAF1817568.1 Phosphoenolpyruvate/pyruvate domain-containing protein [Eremomyces bilateralis CBS 781.70]
MADFHGFKSATARLRELLSRDDHITICPGVYDGLTARIALRGNFDCLYMTGAGTAASRLGMPDLGLVTMNDMLTNAAMIASLDRTVPLIADADTGYGGPVMVARTVKSYIAAGIAGLHLEDQVLSKRCGHLLGKEIVDEDTFLSRIRAAVIAREEMKASIGEVAGDIVLIARTDSLQSLGFDEAIKRLKMAIEVGADVAFLEGPTDVDQCRRACRVLAPTPVLLNNVPGGVTPDLTAKEAQELGFKLMIYPGLMLTAVYDSCTASSAELKSTGTVKLTERQMEGPKALFTTCGLLECIQLDKKAGGQAYSSGV